MPDLIIDPEFKALIPPLSKDEYNNLEQNIIKEGCRDSLVLWGGVLIDGHNRYEICTKHGIEFKTIEKPFESRDDAEIWMIINQFGRRNLIPYVRAELALKLEELFHKKAKENERTRSFDNQAKKEKDGCQNSDNHVSINSPVSDVPETVDDDEETLTYQPKNIYERSEKALEIIDDLKKHVPKTTPDIKKPIEKIDTKKELAKIAGLSHDTIARVKAINEKAPEDVKQKVKAGTISINKAYSAVKTAEKKEADKVKTQEAVQQAETKPIIYKESCIDFLTRYEEKSIDLLITDPPYITDVEDIHEFIDSWLIESIKKIKTTGRAFIFVGAYPRELNAYLSKLLNQNHLILEDILVWTYKNTIGPTPKNTFFQNWQAILYLRGPDAPVWNSNKIVDLFAVKEVNAPDGRQGDRHYKWQKPTDLINLLVSLSTKPGDTVIDCFAGSGTHLISASTLSRNAFGCEISTEPFEIACSRGCITQS